MTVSLASCGDDEGDEPTVNNDLIGNWYGGGDIITFNANGTYTYYELVKLGDKTYEDTWDGLYEYDKKTGLVTIYWGSSVDYYLQIVSIVNNTMVAKAFEKDPSDSEEIVFRRIDDKDMPFIYIGS